MYTMNQIQTALEELDTRKSPELHLDPAILARQLVCAVHALALMDVVYCAGSGEMPASCDMKDKAKRTCRDFLNVCMPRGKYDRRAS